LDIVGASGTSNIARVYNPSTSWSQYALYRAQSDAGSVYSDFGFFRGTSETNKGFVVRSTGGANNLLVEDSGNVGIGTTGPSYLLDVHGSNGSIGGFSDSASNYFGLRLGRTAEDGAVGIPGAADQWIVGSVAGDMTVRGSHSSGNKLMLSGDAGATSVSILPGPKVGIGTTAPGNTLTIGASSSGTIGIGGIQTVVLSADTNVTPTCSHLHIMGSAYTATLLTGSLPAGTLLFVTGESPVAISNGIHSYYLSLDNGAILILESGTWQFVSHPY
jgi:hypothetical protein